MREFLKCCALFSSTVVGVVMSRRADRRRRLAVGGVVLSLGVASASPTQAVVNLFSNFDHASLASWSGSETAINLVGRENHPTTAGWRWLYFRAAGLDGAQPVFSINQSFAGGNGALNNHRMVYSYDNENWLFFDNNQRNGLNFTFSNNAPFSSDEVYVAYAQPYSYGRTADHTAAVLATPWAVPTVSGDAGGVLGETPLAVDDLGRIVPRRDIFGYRVTNPATDMPTTAKRKVVVASGLHSGETLGTHTFEGLIDWLISDDARAARLRDDLEVFAYPVLNAAGRFAGTSRATVDNPNQDPNGLWNPSLWGPHQDIRIAGEAMLADVASTPGESIDAFIDFHSTIPSSVGDDFAFIEIDQGDHLADFWLELRALQPNVRQTDSTGSSWTTANFADLLLNAEVDITFETEFGNNRPLSYYHDLGANFGIAFYNAWVRVANPAAADFDADGDVDPVDLQTSQRGFGSSGDSERHDGDADGDQAVQGVDLLTWQRQFAPTPPDVPGTLAVPEPATLPSLIFAAAAYAGILVDRFRRRTLQPG